MGLLIGYTINTRAAHNLPINRNNEVTDMILIALAICTLLELELLKAVLFTVIFTLCADGAFIYFKLRLGLWDDEREMILRHAAKLKKLTARFFRPFFKKGRARVPLYRQF